VKGVGAHMLRPAVVCLWLCRPSPLSAPFHIAHVYSCPNHTHTIHLGLARPRGQDVQEQRGLALVWGLASAECV
jgi:hypothetical protein